MLVGSWEGEVGGGGGGGGRQTNMLRGLGRGRGVEEGWI